MASIYELPEEVNDKRIRSLGKEVEMKTFKKNVELERLTIERDRLEELPLKIVCVGGFAGGVGTKGVFIDADYLQVWPPVQTYRPPLIGVKFYLKIIRWQRSEAEEPISIKLQFWEIGENERFANICKIYFRGCHGALVFWGAHHGPPSLNEVVFWREKVKEVSPSVPCVLITDNVGKEPLRWIGAGEIFESELALDQFCKENGFVNHFEIKSRDWESGEESAFGQAVKCILEEIVPNEQQEEETSM